MPNMDHPEFDDREETQRQEIVETLSPKTLSDENVFEDVAQAMATVCDVRKAHVSVMESDRQCVVGEVGLDDTTFDRENAFCNYALYEREIVIVEDAEEDGRFSDNPLVIDSPYIRFYAGIPIVVDDVPVGTLCALDSEPRSIDHEERVALFDVVRQLEQYLQLRYEYPKDDPKLRMATNLATLEARMTAALQHGTCSFLNEMITSAKERIEDSRQLIDGLAPIDVDGVADRLGVEKTAPEP